MMYEPYEGKEGIWIYAPNYDSLPNERVMKIYRTKEEWFPIWEEMCEKFVEESTARWQKPFETQLRQARNDYPNLSDEELKREVLHFDYWLSKYEEAPVRARDSVVRRTEEGDEIGFYDIGSYGSFTFVPLEDMPWVRLRAEELSAESGQMCEVCFGNDDLPYDSDHFTECRRCGKSVCMDCDGEMQSHPDWFKVCGECSDVLDNVHDYGAEDMSLKESAKVGFGLGAGLLGFRIVALTGAVALGALLNRR